MSVWTRRRVVALVAVYSAAALTAYVLWIFFSYLFVPMVAANEIPVPQWQRDGYYTLRPGTYENRRHGVTYTINRHGFRGPDFAIEKSRYRIICLGESTTIGIGAPDAETWPARLQEYLGGHVEVINAGVSGSTSREHRAMLRYLLDYTPDLILYYAGRNDHAISALERYPGPRLWTNGRLNFLRHWFIYKRVQLRMLLLPLTDVEEWVTWSNGWARTYRENLDGMYRDASGAGVRFVAVSQLLEQMTSPLSFRTPNWHGLLRQYDALAIQRNVVPPHQFVDVRAAFATDTDGLFDEDGLHLTPRGNERLARAIADALRERGTIPQ